MKGKPFVGIWLDHREAHLFWADERAEIQIQHVTSGYQEEGEPSDRASSGGLGLSGVVVPHASLERRRKESVNHYYKQLLKALHRAEQIYLFGPGQAKRELAKVIGQHKDMDGRLSGVESAEAMSESQMAARVREFFEVPRG